jgi:inner membrane protein
LVGIAVAKAGAERATLLATPTLVIAANAPDIDVASYLGGPYYALAFRRGITHGWPALILLTFLVAAAMLGWDRWVRRRRKPGSEPARAGPLLLLSAAGVLSHPALDWMNTYGMRWGLPFDDAWSYGDALFIVDPWIWLVLGGSVFLASSPSPREAGVWVLLAAASSALVIAALPVGRVLWVLGVACVVAAHVARRPATASARRSLVLGACGLVGVYVAVLVVSDALARRQVFAAAAAEGLEALDVMVAPLPGNPFASEVEVRTRDAYVPGTHRWVGSPRVALRPAARVPLLAAPDDVAGPERERILAAARAMPHARDYLIWSRLPYARIEPAGDSLEVTFADARYDGARDAGSLGRVQVLIPREQGGR